jgi:hypothetical protein
MCAFSAHFIKEVSRSQLCAAAKTLLSKEDRKSLTGAEKQTFLKPLASQFLNRNIVSIKKRSNLANLTRDSVIKTGTF